MVQSDWWAGVLALAGLVLMPQPSFAQETKREMAPHVHGHAKANIAIESGRVAVELIAPGADVVGFEHAPKTAEQKSAVEKARKALKDVSGIISFCRRGRMSRDDDEGRGDRGRRARSWRKQSIDHAHEAKEKHHHGHAEKHDGNHNEFHAEYMFACKNTSAIRRIGFPYLKRFPRTEELDVTVLSAHGQKAYEVTPAKPEISLERTR